MEGFAFFHFQEHQLHYWCSEKLNRMMNEDGFEGGEDSGKAYRMPIAEYPVIENFRKVILESNE